MEMTNVDNLQYYINKGLVLQKIHRVVKFNQSAWLKPYIEKNSKLRQWQKMISKKININF